MSQTAAKGRQFSVHVRHGDAHHARILEEASFEAAAVAYVEDVHPPAMDEPEIRLIVREIATGDEHCYRIDLESGEAGPCE